MSVQRRRQQKKIWLHLLLLYLLSSVLEIIGVAGYLFFTPAFGQFETWMAKLAFMWPAELVLYLEFSLKNQSFVEFIVQLGIVLLMLAPVFVGMHAIHRFLGKTLVTFGFLLLLNWTVLLYAAI
ncbi:MAG: hypothetical protein H6861_00835 [Rhodospirillales bacterium]|nr:hypothetical protein [Rhodospirillales bacterium]